MKKQTELQRLIDQIRSNALSDQELARLLDDQRLLVIANVLLTLPAVEPSADQRSIVDAVLNVATGERAEKELMGNVTVKQLAAASLRALRSDEARRAYQTLTATFSPQELDDLDWFIEHNLTQGGRSEPGAAPH
jgi:hypothetical protein